MPKGLIFPIETERQVPKNPSETAFGYFAKYRTQKVIAHKNNHEKQTGNPFQA